MAATCTKKEILQAAAESAARYLGYQGLLFSLEMMFLV